MASRKRKKRRVGVCNWWSPALALVNTSSEKIRDAATGGRGSYFD